MTVAQDRRRRRKLDESVARGFAPVIARVIKREEQRLLKATSSTAALAAVRTSEWVSALVTLWLSDPIFDIWDEQQRQLGTDFKPTPEVRKILTQTATAHGKAIAETRRGRIERILADGN